MLDKYYKDELNAKQAKEEIQKLTFYPMMFQAARVLRTSGILKETYLKKNEGVTAKEISDKLGIPYYSVNTLLEVGLTVGLVFLREEEKYAISKMGYFLLNDEATRVNLNFTHDVCYKALFHLEESLLLEFPVGLKEIGIETDTIYPELANLEEPIKTSWFEFDHYYSDNAFPRALEIVFQENHKHMLDIGGNTGKWSVACCKHNEDVNVTIVDLPGQWEKAKENIEKIGLGQRISGIARDVLNKNLDLPKDADAVWMSQFLDCFSEEQIIHILTNVHGAINEDASVYILELFWDRQKDLAAAYCLHGTTLYFSAVANGNSKMYHSRDMYRALDKAGFEVVHDEDEVGDFHTLLKCKKK